MLTITILLLTVILFAVVSTSDDINFIKIKMSCWQSMFYFVITMKLLLNAIKSKERKIIRQDFIIQI